MVHDRRDDRSASRRRDPLPLERLGRGSVHGRNPGRVLETSRPHRHVFQWRADSGTYDTKVEIDFEAVAEGTIVKLVETGYEDTPAGMQDLLNRVSGWAQVLTLMKFYLEHCARY
jgi:uncharacterized protein YndB with AHSA1/START domain